MFHGHSTVTKGLASVACDDGQVTYSSRRLSPDVIFCGFLGSKHFSGSTQEPALATSNAKINIDLEQTKLNKMGR